MSNPRPIGFTVAMLLTMLTSLGSAALVVIGGFANPMTTKSDLIVAGDAGTATRLAAAGAPDGATLILAGNVVQWGTAGSSLPTATAAGEIPVSTAAGTTYAATGAAGVRTAIGLGQPTSLAAQQRLDATLRRGPITMRTSGVQGTSTPTTTDTQPSIMTGTSGVVTLYSPTAGGLASWSIGQNGVWTTRGWYISGSGSNLRLAFMLAVNQTIDFSTFLSTAGWHSLAWAIAADGLTVAYAVDGVLSGVSPTISTTPLTPVARSNADTVYIGTNASSTGTTALGLACFAIWNSVLTGAELVAASASPSAGAPTYPSTPTWEWAASAFAGGNVVRINGADYTPFSSPTWWMP